MEKSLLGKWKHQEKEKGMDVEAGEFSTIIGIWW